MKDLRIIFYVVRIIEITIRILEKSFKYTTKLFRKKNKQGKKFIGGVALTLQKVVNLVVLIRMVVLMLNKHKEKLK